MHKRILLLLLFVCCSILMTGCGGIIELTDDETRMIAEYSAELLMKYDMHYTDRVQEGAEDLEEKHMEELENEIDGKTTESTQEDATSEESTETSTEEGADDKPGDKPAEDVGSESDIAVITGIEGASIKFKDNIFTDRYPETDEDADGEFMHLEPTQGYHLMVLRFNVKATGDAPVDVNLLDKDVAYKVICNGKSAASPMLTILMNDLGALETTVNPGEDQEAVLVFQISDSVYEQLDSVKLTIEYNGLKNEITVV